MRLLAVAICCATLLGCGGGGGGGGGDASVNNDSAIVGVWVYRTNNIPYAQDGCGGVGLFATDERVKMTFDGKAFTQLIETCFAAPGGNIFQVTRDEKGTYTTGDLLTTITTSTNGAITDQIKVKAIDVYNTTRNDTTYASYGINSAGNLILGGSNGANDGSTPALRRVDMENGLTLIKMN